MDHRATVQGREFYRLAQVFDRSDDVPAEELRLIRGALRQAHAAVAASRTRLSEPEAGQVIAAALRHLLTRRDQFQAALLLAQNTAAALADLTDIATLRCRTLLLLRRRDEAVAEADRLLALQPADPQRDRAVVDVLKSAILHSDLAARFGLHDLIWGPPGATAFETLQNLDVTPFLPMFDGPLVPDLLAIRKESAEAHDALHRDLAWGVAATQYRKFLAHAVLDHRRQRQGTTDSVTEDFLESCASLDDASPSPDLQALIAQGRSVVLLQSHSGVRGVVSQSLADLDCPLSLIGKGPRLSRIRDGDFNITTDTAADLPLQFLKLAKLARKGPRVIRLLPDGRDGREFAEIDLFGSPVQVGLGGASLALHGKAVLAFVKTHWTGKVWVPQVVIGPDLALAGDRAAAEKLFLAFYAESLRKLLLGPARDIGGTGGFLVSLRRPKA